MGLAIGQAAVLHKDANAGKGAPGCWRHAMMVSGNVYLVYFALAHYRPMNNVKQLCNSRMQHDFVQVTCTEGCGERGGLGKHPGGSTGCGVTPLSCAASRHWNCALRCASLEHCMNTIGKHQCRLKFPPSIWRRFKDGQQCSSIQAEAQQFWFGCARVVYSAGAHGGDGQRL